MKTCIAMLKCRRGKIDPSKKARFMFQNKDVHGIVSYIHYFNKSTIGLTSGANH